MLLCIKFVEWLRNDWQPQAPNKNEWYNNKTKQVVKTDELFEIFILSEFKIKIIYKK